MEHVFVRVHFVSIRYDYSLTTGEENTSTASQKEIGQLMVRSRFGISSIVVSRRIISYLAKYLGRVLAKINSQSDISAMTEGSLLVGSVCICEPNNQLETLASNISYNIDNGSLKYITHNEITINSSFTAIFEQSQLTKSTNGLNRNRLRHLLKIYGFEEYKNKLCHLFWKVTVLLDRLINLIIEDFKELKKKNTLNEMQICDCILNKHIMFNVAEIQRDHLLTLLIHLPKELRNIETYVETKTMQIKNLLDYSNIVFVVGDPLSGKTELIKRATSKENRHIHLSFYSDFNCLTNNLQTGKLHWLVFNGGRLSSATLNWLELQITEPALATASPFLNLGHNDKLIIETEVVPSQLEQIIPVVRVDFHEQSFRHHKNNTLTNTQTEQLEGIANLLEGLSKRLFFYRFHRITEHFYSFNDVSFESVLYVCLQSLSEQQQSTFNTDTAFDKFHTQNEFVNLIELEEVSNIRRQLYFAVYWTELLLRLSFIPFLVAQHSTDQLIMKKLLVDHLTRLFNTPITLTITPQTTLENIVSFMETCKILFANDSGNDSGTVLLLEGAKCSSEEIMEYLRYNENNNRFKFILLSSTDISIQNIRMRKCLFRVPYDGINLKYTDLNPYLLYRSTIKELGAVTPYHHLILVELTKQLIILESYDKNYQRLHFLLQQEVKIENNAVDLLKLLELYNEHEETTATKVGYWLCDKVHITESIISYILTIENLFALPGRIIILPGYNVEEVNNCVRISIERNKLTTITFRDTVDYFEWKNTMLQVMECSLINNKPTILLLYCANFSSQIFYDIVRDILSLINTATLPLNYLTRGFIANFSEKHTMEGRNIWAKLSEMVKANLRICITLSREQFENILRFETELIHSSIVIFQHQTTLEQTREVMQLIISDGDILMKNEIPKVVSKMIEVLTIIPTIEPTKFARLFVHLIKKRSKLVQAAIVRYEKGMEKLRYAQEQTNHLQSELLRLQPELLRTAIETSILMSKIERETIEVENAREVVAANEHKANQAATKAQTLKAESEADLASAIPALEAAIESLSTMTQSDVSTLKTMRFPPYGVRLCMEAVCILLAVKPAKITDSLGGITEDYWIPGQKLLSDIHFLTKIRNYPRDKITNKTMRVIREKYLSKEEFDPQNVKQCSLAAEGLCLWVQAVELYHRISKFVQPKKEKLRKIEILVKQHMKQLDAKRKALQEVTEKLQSLSDQFSQMSQRKQELQSQMTSCEMRMERAERLVLALGGEKHKWLSKIEEMSVEASRLNQTSIITAVALLEYGGKNECERKKIMNKLELNLFGINALLTDISNKQLLQACTLPLVVLIDEGEDAELVTSLFNNAIFATDNNLNTTKMCMTAGTVVVTEFNKETAELANYIRYVKDNQKITFLNNEEVIIEDGFRMILYSSKLETEISNSIIHINFTYSESDIRKKVAEALGRSNWPTYLENYNNSVNKITNTQRILEEMDTDMLEMLGNKEGLDEEKAIELLAQTKELQTTLNILSTERNMFYSKLKELHSKLETLISWSFNIFMILRKLGSFCLFHQYNIRWLINIIQYKLPDNIEEADELSIPRWIHCLSEHIWTTMSASLTPPIKLVLRYCMKRKLIIGDYGKCGFNDFQRLVRSFKDTDRFRELGSYIWKSEPSEPILVVSDELSSSWIYYIKDLRKNVNNEFWPINTMLKELVSKKIAEPSWVVISLNEWGDIDSEAVVNTLQLLKANELNASFRLILTKTGLHNMSQAISKFGRRFAMQSDGSLNSLLRTTLEQSIYRKTYTLYNENSKKQFIQLIVFFYAIYRRFATVFTGIDLHFTLRAYMECHRHSDHSDLSTKSILSAVVEPILMNKLTNQFHISIFNTVFQWIFEGLSRIDDIALRNIIGNQWSESSILEKLESVSFLSQLSLSGVSPTFLDFKEEKKEAELFDFTRKLLGAEAVEPRDNTKQLEEYCVRLPPERNELSLWAIIWTELKEELQRTKSDKKRSKYLVSLLEADNILEIDISLISDPQRMLYVIKTEFARKQHTCISQISFDCSTIPFEKGTTSLLLNNCKLCGAQLQKSVDLIELTSGMEYQSSITLYIRPVEISKMKTNTNNKTIPLLSTTDERLCDVRIRTTHAITHWTLRGAHFTTQQQ